MSMTEIKRIIRKTAEKRGYRLEERESTSTSSMYFKLYYETTSLLFRVSDHATKANVVTLRTDKKISAKFVENFIDNRCRDLGARRTYALLGRI